MPKVAILGAGQVGTAAATYLAERNLADIVFVDVVNYGLAAGKAVDLAAASAMRGFSVRLEGTDKLEAAEGAAVVVNCAGVPRKPGMDRLDLLRTNAQITADLAREVARRAPHAVFIQVANPLDVLCYVALRASGFPRQRVLGLSGVLDASRFRTFLADALGCAPEDVSALVLGGHADSMVPITRTASVGGVPVTELLPAATIAAVTARTRNAGAEVVKLLQTGSAFSSTGAAICAMVEPLLAGRPRLLPACVFLEGEYGLRDVCLGVPVLLGREGVQRIVEFALTPEERAALSKSADEVRKGIEAVKLSLTAQAPNADDTARVRLEQ
jgi:malate dehydrogenase